MEDRNDTMGSFGTTFPYPQRTYFPMFLDDKQCLPFSSFYVHIVLSGTIPGGVYAMYVNRAKGGNVTRTYMYMFCGFFVLEREDNQFFFRPPSCGPISAI